MNSCKMAIGRLRPEREVRFGSVGASPLAPVRDRFPFGRKSWVAGLAAVIIFLTGSMSNVTGAGGGFADFAPNPGPNFNPGVQPNENSTTAVRLELYNGQFFTIEKLEGWRITTAGYGPTLSIWMRDPRDPARQTFMFGAVGPFYLSQQQKNIDHQYMRSGGYPIQWNDMPVVSPATASAFLGQWNALIRTNIARQFAPELPRFENLTIISTQPVSSRFGGQAELVRALFTQNGKVAEGLFVAEVVQFVPFMNGPGGHQGYTFLFSGITAPKREFAIYRAPLMRSLESFRLSEQYVRAYIASSEKVFQGILQAGQTLRETSDIITQGWNTRQKVHDILSEKRSDAMLGKERLYDPNTGQTYEFPNGWYDKYNINRNKFNNPNLQPIPDGNHKVWTSPPLNGPNQIYIQ